MRKLILLLCLTLVLASCSADTLTYEEHITRGDKPIRDNGDIIGWEEATPDPAQHLTPPLAPIITPTSTITPTLTPTATVVPPH